MDLSLFQSKPNKIFTPQSLAELQEILQDKSSPIIIAGGKTNVYGLLTSKEPYILIETKALNKIITPTIYEVGITLKEIRVNLEKENLTLPITIMNEKNAFLGGSFASNCFGYGTYRFGFFRDCVKRYWIIDDNGEEKEKTVDRKTNLKEIQSTKTDSNFGIISKIEVEPIVNKKLFYYSLPYQKNELIKILENNQGIRTILIFGKKSFSFWGLDKRLLYIESELEKSQHSDETTKFIERSKFAVPDNIPKPRVECSVIVEKLDELETLMDFVDTDTDSNFVVNIHKDFFIITILFIKRNFTEQEGFKWLSQYKNMVQKHTKFRFGRIFNTDKEDLHP